MPRALTASRVSVPREHQAEYVATLAQLAVRRRARGGHLWLFRDPATPGAFLEFNENATTQGLGGRRASDIDEAALERRLEAIATYAPEPRVVWEEVSLEEV